MPRFSTYRPKAPKPPRNPKSVNTASPRQRLITCLLLPIWFLVVVNVHSAIAFYQELDDSVLIEPADAEAMDLADSEIMPGEAAEQLQQQLAQKFFIEPDANGNVNGRLTTIGSGNYANMDTRMTVVLLQNGNEVRKITTRNGDFTFDAVPTGPGGQTYTLLAYGAKGFLAETINVRKSANGNTSITIPGESVRQYVSLNNNGNNTQDSQAPEGEIFLPDLFQVVPNNEGDIVDNEAVVENMTYHVELVAAQPGYNRLETIFDDHVPTDAGVKDFDYSRAIAQKDLELFGCHEYELKNNGEFCGRIVVPQQDLRDMSSMQVVLTDRNRQIAEVTANEDGNFTFSEIEPGAYTLVAAGDEGFGAVAVRLVDDVVDLTDEADIEAEADEAQAVEADADDVEESADPFDEDGQTRTPTLRQSYVAIQDGSATRGDIVVQEGVVQEGIVQDGFVQDGVIVQEGIGVQQGVVVQNNFDPCGCCRVQLVCQPNDVQYIGDVISDLNIPNYAQGAPNFPGPLGPSPIEFQGAGFASAPIGPAPSFGFSAPAAVAPSVGFAPAAGFGGGGLLSGVVGSTAGRLAIAGGIVALALSGDGDGDVPASPDGL